MSITKGMFNVLEGIYTDHFKDSSAWSLVLNLQETVYLDVTARIIAIGHQHNNTVFYLTEYADSINKEAFDRFLAEIYPDHNRVYVGREVFSLALYSPGDTDSYETVGMIAYNNRTDKIKKNASVLGEQVASK